jgi:hypothetical protein
MSDNGEHLFLLSFGFFIPFPEDRLQIEKLAKDCYRFLAFLGIARGTLPPLFRETGIHV